LARKTVKEVSAGQIVCTNIAVRKRKTGSLRSWHASGEAGMSVFTTKNGTSTKKYWKYFNAEFGRQACAVFFRSDWVGVAKACARSVFLFLLVT
jgi:hypothetical protein